MKQGRFITFEGIDGSGKTTQLELTKRWLEAKGLDVLATREPGDTPIGRRIRRLLLDGRFVPCAETELLLFLADRAQHVREVIGPALEGGKWVLCDRFTDSTLAYQLAARRLRSDPSEQILQSMLRFAECGARPDLTFWFDLEIGDARRRLHARRRNDGESTRLDEEAEAFHQRVRKAYARQWRLEPQRIRRIDAGADIEQIQQELRRQLAARWPELG